MSVQPDDFLRSEHTPVISSQVQAENITSTPPAPPAAVPLSSHYRHYYSPSPSLEEGSLNILTFWSDATVVL